MLAKNSPKPSVKRGHATINRKRGSNRESDPNTVYDYALRCAIRAHLEQTENRAVSGVSSPSGSFKKKEERHHFLQSSLSNLSEKFGDDKSNENLTRGIVEGLIQRLKDICNQKDVSKEEYRKEEFRRIARDVKEKMEKYPSPPVGTINDNVILFLISSKNELGSSNKDTLNQFVACYVEIVVQTLQQVAPSSATPELLERLSGFYESPKRPQKRSSSLNANIISNTPSPIEGLEELPMIKTIKKLFQIDNTSHRKKLMELVSICTESAVMLDLKSCRNMVYTVKAEDFQSLEAHENWQKKEGQQINELMNAMLMLNPNLSIASNSNETNGRSGSLLARQSANPYSLTSSDSNVPSLNSANFVFIPPEPRTCFRLLMEKCLDYDIENFNQIAESEKAKTSILSKQSNELLKECWNTWRLPSSFRDVLYLSLIKTKFDQEELDFTDIAEALKSLDKAIKENNIKSWTKVDRKSLITTLKGLDNTLLRELSDKLRIYWKISPSWVQDLVELLKKIYSNPAYLEEYSNPKQGLCQLEETVKTAAMDRWSSIVGEANDDDQEVLERLLAVADTLSKELSSLSGKKYPQPILDVLPVTSIVMARQLPCFALEMENWANSPGSRVCPIDVAFELYHKVLCLEKLYDKYGPERKTSLFKVESWFLPHVKRWLTKTSESTLDWVENAIAQDQFQRYSDSVLYSSSIVDLFTMFSQAVDFIDDLQWPNDTQHCSIETFLSKIIGEGIRHYCNTIEDLVRIDLFPSMLDHNQHELQSVSILDKARYQFMGTRALNKTNSTPEDLTPEMCVKLNDMEAAKEKLDRLYQVMNVDEIAQFMRENIAPKSVSKSNSEKNDYLYTVRVIRAENLRPMDANGLSDPYVTFVIDGKIIARTNTVYETLNPRWDREFDFTMSERAVDVLAIVNDEDLITADEECGVTWFKLAPEYYENNQQDDLVLQLSPQGSLVLRITMEDEKNDIQYWFGKAFRSLKSSENDAAALIVDKMGPYIRQCLSRHVIDKLLGRDQGGFFSAFSRVSSKQVDPDLQDCEDAIAPLLDYLEHNLRILNNNMNESNMYFVVLKIWDQILQSLDSVMLPPLSEQLSEVKPLDVYELHVVLKWLELLKIFFSGGEDGDAIPLENLENSQYLALLSINAAYNHDTQTLINGCKSLTNKKTRSSIKPAKRTDRSKTVYYSKNTIRKKPSGKDRNKRSSAVNLPCSDDILRMLRMRHDRQVADFLRQEFQTRTNFTSQPSPSSPIEAPIETLQRVHNSVSDEPNLPETPTSLFESNDSKVSNGSSSYPPPLPTQHSGSIKGVTLTD